MTEVKTPLVVLGETCFSSSTWRPGVYLNTRKFFPLNIFLPCFETQVHTRPDYSEITTSSGNRLLTCVLSSHLREGLQISTASLSVGPGGRGLSHGV
jgi:hypothetical protein